MHKILISIIFISNILYSASIPNAVDIIDIKILKEDNKVTIKKSIKRQGVIKPYDSKSISQTPKNKNVITVSIPTIFYKTEKYTNIKVTNAKEIKSKFLIVDNKLKVFIPQNEYIEVFKIEAQYIKGHDIQRVK